MSSIGQDESRYRPPHGEFWRWALGFAALIAVSAAMSSWLGPYKTQIDLLSAALLLLGGLRMIATLPSDPAQVEDEGEDPEIALRRFRLLGAVAVIYGTASAAIQIYKYLSE